MSNPIDTRNEGARTGLVVAVPGMLAQHELDPGHFAPVVLRGIKRVDENTYSVQYNDSGLDLSTKTLRTPWKRGIVSGFIPRALAAAAGPILVNALMRRKTSTARGERLDVVAIVGVAVLGAAHCDIAGGVRGTVVDMSKGAFFAVPITSMMAEGRWAPEFAAPPTSALALHCMGVYDEDRAVFAEILGQASIGEDPEAGVTVDVLAESLASVTPLTFAPFMMQFGRWGAGARLPCTVASMDVAVQTCVTECPVSVVAEALVRAGRGAMWFQVPLAVGIALNTAHAALLKHLGKRAPETPFLSVFVPNAPHSRLGETVGSESLETLTKWTTLATVVPGEVAVGLAVIKRALAGPSAHDERPPTGMKIAIHPSAWGSMLTTKAAIVVEPAMRIALRPFVAANLMCTPDEFKKLKGAKAVIIGFPSRWRNPVPFIAWCIRQQLHIVLVVDMNPVSYAPVVAMILDHCGVVTRPAPVLLSNECRLFDAVARGALGDFSLLVRLFERDLSVVEYEPRLPVYVCATKAWTRALPWVPSPSGPVLEGLSVCDEEGREWVVTKAVRDDAGQGTDRSARFTSMFTARRDLEVHLRDMLPGGTETKTWSYQEDGRPFCDMFAPARISVEERGVPPQRAAVMFTLRNMAAMPPLEQAKELVEKLGPVEGDARCGVRNRILAQLAVSKHIMSAPPSLCVPLGAESSPPLPDDISWDLDQHTAGLPGAAGLVAAGRRAYVEAETLPHVMESKNPLHEPLYTPSVFPPDSVNTYTGALVEEEGEGSRSKDDSDDELSCVTDDSGDIGGADDAWGGSDTESEVWDSDSVSDDLIEDLVPAYARALACPACGPVIRASPRFPHADAGATLASAAAALEAAQGTPPLPPVPEEEHGDPDAAPATALDAAMDAESDSEEPVVEELAAKKTALLERRKARKRQRDEAESVRKYGIEELEDAVYELAAKVGCSACAGDGAASSSSPGASPRKKARPNPDSDSE